MLGEWLEPAQSLNTEFIEVSRVVVITTTPRYQKYLNSMRMNFLFSSHFVIFYSYDSIKVVTRLRSKLKFHLWISLYISLHCYKICQCLYFCVNVGTLTLRLVALLFKDGRWVYTEAAQGISAWFRNVLKLKSLYQHSILGKLDLFLQISTY